MEHGNKNWDTLLGATFGNSFGDGKLEEMLGVPAQLENSVRNCNQFVQLCNKGAAAPFKENGKCPQNLFNLFITFYRYEVRELQK